MNYTFPDHCIQNNIFDFMLFSFIMINELNALACYQIVYNYVIHINLGHTILYALIFLKSDPPDDPWLETIRVPSVLYSIPKG